MNTPSFSLDRGLTAVLPPKTALQWGVVPLERRSDGTVQVLSKAPLDLEQLDNLRVLFGAPVAAATADEAQWQAALKDRYGVGADALDEIAETATDSADVEVDATPADTAMVRFVNDLIAQAQHEHATDIHIEPFDGEISVRFRVDGMLHNVPASGALVRHLPLLTSSIKVMAHLSIAEKRLPQDGRIRFSDAMRNVQGGETNRSFDYKNVAIELEATPRIIQDPRCFSRSIQWSKKFSGSTRN
jgi:type II secretory ATPase GspE/PulE/Tfp pilus assembly ATPase PilB-like protein